MKSVYLSFDGFEKELQQEISLLGGRIYEHKERLFLASFVKRDPIWAQNIWRNPHWLKFESVSQGASAIKSLGPLWANHSFQLHRRSELIQEKIHRFQPKPLQFGTTFPQKPFGAWTLWDDKTILASADTNSALPLGKVHFQESKIPPSRAYLKLWEVFSIHGVKIAKNTPVMDLGASPGGWTWVLSEIGCHVTAVDKAPLDPKVTAKKNVVTLKKDAFLLDPSSLELPEVIFSDIICDPQRLYELVQNWAARGCQKFVCTIKFKGATDFKITQSFLEIPNSRIVHLFANKHEVTWIKGL